MKFCYNWPGGFIGEDLWMCRRTKTDDDGQLSLPILYAPLAAFGSGKLKTIEILHVVFLLQLMSLFISLH